MEHSLTILRAMALIVALSLSSCYSSSNNTQTTDRSAVDSELQIAQSEIQEEFEMFRSEKENRLMGYNRTIDEIEQHIENEPDSNVRGRLEAELNEYKATHRELQSELNNYEMTNEEHWKNFKDSFTSKIDNLGNSLDDLFTRASTGLTLNPY